MNLDRMRRRNPTNFYLTLAEYHDNLKDTGTGLMEFWLAASDAGL